MRHFLDLDAFDAGTLRGLIDDARRCKEGSGTVHRDGTLPLAGRTLAMIFEKPSTRTRTSFTVAMQHLGGAVLVLDNLTSQLGRGETLADTARVLSRYVDAIMIRTDAHAKLLELAEHASVPVINGLTDDSHPCQIMADVLTFEEHRGPIAGAKVAWLGDGNNVAASWVHAAVHFGFAVDVACPEQLRPRQEVLDWAADRGGNGVPVRVVDDPAEALNGADCVVTDTWVSMGDGLGDDDSGSRHNLLAPYRVDAAAMAQAKPDALFMHCLPAHRGEEVTAEVIDGPQSVVWDEAENRLHAQKAILAWCLDTALT